jgi:hypothetical protein
LAQRNRSPGQWLGPRRHAGRGRERAEPLAWRGGPIHCLSSSPSPHRAARSHGSHGICQVENAFFLCLFARSACIRSGLSCAVGLTGVIVRSGPVQACFGCVSWVWLSSLGELLAQVQLLARLAPIFLYSGLPLARCSAILCWLWMVMSFVVGSSQESLVPRRGNRERSE